MTASSAPASLHNPAVTLDELAAAVVVAVHRLTKQATLYTTENQAQLRQVEQTCQAVAEYGRQTGRNPRLFFTERAVFVGGRLLYGGRQTYEAAIELGKTLNDFGVDEMAIGHDVPADDLRDYQQAVAAALRGQGPSPATLRYQRIRLRRGTPPGRRPGTQSEALPPEQQLVRLYATAIVVMRRFLEGVQRGELGSPVRVRRIAQLLAELGAVQSPAFLGATALYNARHEHAGRAVNSAMLALGMARQITDDVRLLARIAMAALLYDVGLPRAAGSDPTGADRIGLALPILSEDQLAELPGATAATISALTGMGEAGVTYAVLVYEALKLNHRKQTTPLYEGEQHATLEARIVATARQFTTLLASTDEELSADDAMRRILADAEENADKTAVRLLMAAIGLVPSGALVQLSTGAVAQVVQAASDPMAFYLPVVRPVVDASGGRILQSGLLDLAKQRRRKGAVEIRRVVAMSSVEPAPTTGRGGNDSGSEFELQTDTEAPPSSEDLYEYPTLRPEEHPSEAPSDTDDLADALASALADVVIDASDPPRSVEPRSVEPRSAGAVEMHDEDLEALELELDRISRPPLDDDDVPSMVLQAIVNAASDAPAATNAQTTPLLDVDDTQETAPVVDDTQQSQPPIDDTQETFAPFHSSSAPPVSAPSTRRRLFGSDAPSEPRQARADSAGQRSAAHDRRLAERRARSRMLVDPPEDAASASDSQPASPAASHPTTRRRSADIEWARTRLAGRKPSAKGRLDKTPLVHLLVYALDRELSGTTMLVTPSGETHFYYYDRGIPAKARCSRGIAPLDRVLLNLGLLDSAQLQKSLTSVSRTAQLHGQYLLNAGLLTEDELALALAHQVMNKMQFMLTLPPLTRYAYFADVNLLADYGGAEMCQADPLALIMAGIRALGTAAIVKTTLAKLNNRPLRLQRSANIRLLRLHPQEQSIIDLLRARPLTLRELLYRKLAPPSTVHLLTYALVVTRALNLGPGRMPIGHGRDLPTLNTSGQERASRGARSPSQPPRQRTPSPSQPPPRISIPPSSRSTSRPRAPMRRTPAVRVADARRRSPKPRLRRPTTPIGTPLPPAVNASPALVNDGEAAIKIPSRPVDKAALERPKQNTPAPTRLTSEQIANWHANIDSQTYYDILGVVDDATVSDIQSCYFALARVWHPDRLPDGLVAQRTEAARVFARINEAFQTLSVTGKRQDYDRLVSAGGGTAEDRAIVERAVDSAMLFQKAEILFRRGEYDRAAEQLAKAIENDPDEPSYRALRAWVEAHLLGAAPSEEERPVYYRDQIVALNDVIEQDPKYERALYYRAELYKRSGKLQRAMRDFRAVVQLNPHNIDAAREVRLFERRASRTSTGKNVGILGRWFRKN